MYANSPPRNTPSPIHRRLLALALSLPAVSLAQPTHPWITAPKQSFDPTVYFTNLQHNDEVQSPFVVRFGLSRWGVAPAGQNLQSTGHHHLLLNKKLPLPPDKPIPFDANHLHFGRGQMETVLNLPPGPHTLRLLFANHAHVPYFMYSPEITVHVRAGKSALPENHGKQPTAEILKPAPGEHVKGAFRVNFHASGMNIANEKTTTKDTGHFQLTLKPLQPEGKEVVLDFSDGATETWLHPPAGTYQLTLGIKSHQSGATVATSPPTSIRATPTNAP